MENYEKLEKKYLKKEIGKQTDILARREAKEKVRLGLKYKQDPEKLDEKEYQILKRKEARKERLKKAGNAFLSFARREVKKERKPFSKAKLAVGRAKEEPKTKSNMEKLLGL